MKLKSTLTHAKISSSTLWHYETLITEVEYFNTKYVNTGKIIVNRTFSDDGLIMTLEHVYSSLESWQEFMEDDVLIRIRNEKEIYNAENDIFLISFDFEEMPSE